MGGILTPPDPGADPAADAREDSVANACVDSAANARADSAARHAPVASLFQQAATLHRQGRWAEADALCDEVMRADPAHAGAWHLRGLAALAAGDADRGVRYLEQSLRIDPSQPGAHLNVGTYRLHQRQPEQALASFDHALRINPGYPIAWYNRGNALRDLGRLDEALGSFDRALRLQPGHWQAANNRGLVLLALARPQDALAAFEDALRLEPDSAEMVKNIAAALIALGRPLDALEWCERVCGAAAEDAGAWSTRGDALMALHRTEDALESYTRALEIQHDFPAARVNRCGALLALHRPAEALRDAEAALGGPSGRQGVRDGIRTAPYVVQGLVNGGNALLALGRADDALARYDSALSLDPACADAIYNRSLALRRLMRYRESAECHEALLRISPERDYALGHLFQLRRDGCDWTDHDSLVTRIEQAVAQRRKVVHPMSLLLADSPQLQRVSAELFAQDAWPADASVGPCVPPPRAAGSRIRVAFVSADFGEHPVSYLLVGVLERLDRRRFEVIGISLAPARTEPFAQRVRAAFDRFVDVADWSDRRIALQLREWGVDIAVDLMGFTQGMRLGIFAYRAAPVQVGFLGYAGTLGVPYMDYLLADAVAIPEGRKDCFAEQVVRLPHCFLPNDDRREIAAMPTRSEAGLPGEGLVLCAFSNACKIGPDVYALWLRLLRAVPGGVLWLRDVGLEAQANLQRAAERHGVDRARLVFAARVADMPHHLARLSRADLFLDTYPYNAHSTACDALWSGVPVLTCAGRSLASRVAASALTAAGLPELITGSLAEYEQRALELAENPAVLRALRARLAANRGRLPLFDTAGFSRDLGTALCTMHERALRGETPEGFAVDRMPA